MSASTEATSPAASRDERILAVLGSALVPMSVQQIGEAIGEAGNRGEACRPVLKRLVAAGAVLKLGDRRKVYERVQPHDTAEGDPMGDLPAPVGLEPTASVEEPDIVEAPPPPSPLPLPAGSGGLETRDRILAAVYGADAPIGAGEVARLAGVMPSDAGVLLRAFAADGFVQTVGDKGRLWVRGIRVPCCVTPIEALAASAASAEVERFAVDIPDHGHAGITDEDVLDEIEAEKTWSCAAVLRAANTAWGIDMGLDADVREARALMAEARQQVRARAQLGHHHRAGAPRPPPCTLAGRTGGEGEG